jgi:mono/diheme cytochrome c family protein
VPIASYFSIPLYSIGYAGSATAQLVTQTVAGGVTATVPQTVTPATAVTADPSSLCDAKIKALNDKYELRIAQLEAMVGKAEPAASLAGTSRETPLPPAPLNTPNPGLGVFVGKCANCHEAAVAAAKGGGRTLFDGNNPRHLDDKAGMAILRNTYHAKMPKDAAPLTDQEFSDLLSYILSQK